MNHFFTNHQIKCMTYIRELQNKIIAKAKDSGYPDTILIFSGMNLNIADLKNREYPEYKINFEILLTKI